MSLLDKEEDEGMQVFAAQQAGKRDLIDRLTGLMKTRRVALKMVADRLNILEMSVREGSVVRKSVVNSVVNPPYDHHGGHLSGSRGTPIRPKRSLFPGR